jgi:hypothetical protein
MFHRRRAHSDDSPKNESAPDSLSHGTPVEQPSPEVCSQPPYRSDLHCGNGSDGLLQRSAPHAHPSFPYLVRLPSDQREFADLSRSLTMVAQKPSIVIEQATSSYSFRFSELSQPI